MADSSKQTKLMAFGTNPSAAAVLNGFSVGSDLVATGTVITDALDLVNEYNHITTSSASTGVQLPDWPVGSPIFVDNASGQTLNIWPHSSSGTINGGSGASAQTIATAKLGFLVRRTSTDWRYTLIN